MKEVKKTKVKPKVKKRKKREPKSQFRKGVETLIMFGSLWLFLYALTHQQW